MSWVESDGWLPLPMADPASNASDTYLSGLSSRQSTHSSRNWISPRSLAQDAEPATTDAWSTVPSRCLFAGFPASRIPLADEPPDKAAPGSRNGREYGNRSARRYVSAHPDQVVGVGPSSAYAQVIGPGPAD